MTDPARLIAIHTLIGAITEGGDAIVEHYRREGPSPDLDAMIAAYRTQVSVLLTRVALPADPEEPSGSPSTKSDGTTDQPRSPHPHFSIQELQLMEVLP